MATTTAYAEVQDQFLSTLRQSQSQYVKFVEAWATAASKLPTVPLTLPLSEQQPSTEEVVESSFDFAQKLLTAQHDFARDIVKASAPVVKAAKPAAKSAV